MIDTSEHASADDFHILGLEPDAPVESVKAAYISLVKTWHPDRYWGDSVRKKEAEERLKTINAAYRRIRKSWKAHPQRLSRSGPSVGNLKAAGKAPDSKTRFTERRARFLNETILNLFGGGRTFFRGREQDVFRCLLVLTAIFLMVSLATQPSISHWYEKTGFLSLTPKSPVIKNTDLLPKAIPDRARSPEVPSSQNNIAPPPDSALEPLKKSTEIIEGGKSYFTLGSSEHELSRIQGRPSKIQGNTWIYGLSSVVLKNGKVSRYNNFDGTLKVRVQPSFEVSADQPPTHFSLGSSRDEVLSVQGTPTRIDKKWYYGFSVIDFKDDRVVGFNNFFNNLKIIMLPRKDSVNSYSGGHFTIGSGQDEVLAVQGTPTGIQGNLWSYQLSTILFQDGYVRSVSDLSGNLLFLSKE